MKKKNKWYILNIITKYESDIIDKIKKLLFKKKYKIYNFIDKEVKFINNRKYIYKKRLLPGYLIINIALDYLLLYKIKKINGVIGFLNERQNKLPLPLNSDELNKFLKKTKKKSKSIKIGSTVKINTGLFLGLTGKVKNIKKNRVNLLIDIFGGVSSLKIDKDDIINI